MNSIKPGGSLTKRYAPPGVVVLALILIAFSPRLVSAYTIVMFATVIMYITMSVSWNIFSGPTGYQSLATAAFFGVGVYAAAFLGDKVPLPLLMLAGGAISFILAFIVGAITLRLRGVYFTIFTFGLVLLLQNLILWYEIKFSGTRGRTVVSIDPVTVFYCMFAAMVLVLLAAYLIKRSRFGMALAGIGESEEAAAHAGINTTFIKVLAFAISSFAVGAVGAAKATTMIYIDPPIAFNVLMSFMPVLMVIFGGTNTFFGPIIGAVALAYLQELLTTQFPKLYMIIFGGIMLVAILFLPNGVMGLLTKIGRSIRKGVAKHADT